MTWSEMRFKSMTQCNQLYDTHLQKAMALSGVSKKMYQAGVTKALFASDETP